MQSGARRPRPSRRLTSRYRKPCARWFVPAGTPNELHSSVPIALEESMLWTIFVILLILWLLGFSFHVAGGLVHILLVVAVIVLIFNLLGGRRSAV